MLAFWCKHPISVHPIVITNSWSVHLGNAEQVIRLAGDGWMLKLQANPVLHTGIQKLVQTRAPIACKPHLEHFTATPPPHTLQLGIPVPTHDHCVLILSHPPLLLLLWLRLLLQLLGLLLCHLLLLLLGLLLCCLLLLGPLLCHLLGLGLVL